MNQQFTNPYARNSVGRQRSRWLGLIVTFALLVGSGTAFGQNPADFDLNAQSNVSGSTILTRWSNWVRSY